MVAPTIVDKRQEANYLPFKVEASLVDGVADMSVARRIQVDLITVSLSDVPKEFSGDRPCEIRCQATICLILRQ